MHRRAREDPLADAHPLYRIALGASGFTASLPSRYLAHVRKDTPLLVQWSRRGHASKFVAASCQALRVRPDIGGGVNPNHALRGCGSGSIPRSTCRGAFPRARARRAAPMATIRPQQGRRGATARERARGAQASDRTGRALGRDADASLERDCLESRPGRIRSPAGIWLGAPRFRHPTHTSAGGHRVGGDGPSQAPSSIAVNQLGRPAFDGRGPRPHRKQDLALAVHRSPLARVASCSIGAPRLHLRHPQRVTPTCHASQQKVMHCEWLRRLI
jgi:hypothetical protein